MILRGGSGGAHGAALRGAAPEVFQPVQLARGPEQDMDDDVVAIHKDPLGGGIALDAQSLEAPLPAELGHAVGKGLGLAHGARRGHDHGLGKGVFAVQFKAGHVFGLVLREKGGESLHPLGHGHGTPGRGAGADGACGKCGFVHAFPISQSRAKGNGRAFWVPPGCGRRGRTFLY